MDHLLAHEADAVPALGDVSESSAPPPAAMDVDDDEENEDLRAALKLSKAPEAEAAGGGEVQAKVRSLLLPIAEHG
jgi:hypothetical protein